jgi:hypothetical protein
MKYLIILLVSFVCLNSNSFGQSCHKSSRGPNILYVTFDGVRAHEFFHGTDPLLSKKVSTENKGEIFKQFWNEIAPQGVVYGGTGPFSDHYRVASNYAVSLPSYQSMMAGFDTKCDGNHCGQIKFETGFERIKRELNLKKEEVALFGSWFKMAHSVEKTPGTLLVNTGLNYKMDGLEDPTLKALSEQAQKDLPRWAESRKDKYTWDMGMHFLKTKCPRVLYISLVDSDEWGHENNYPEYVKILKQYDQYLVDLIKTLDGMGEYGKNTTLFVSTDHSRGFGPLWKTHGVTNFSEKNIFLFVKGPSVEPKGQIKDLKKRDHRYLRGTFEKLMGLVPFQSPDGINRVL